MDIKNRKGKYVRKTDMGWERYTILKWPHQYFHKPNFNIYVEDIIIASMGIIFSILLTILVLIIIGVIG